MAYQRNYRRSFRRPQRRSAAPRSKEVTWTQVAQKAWSGVQSIRKLINVETHIWDTTIGATVSSTGSVTHLTEIAIGDTKSTRTGSSVLTKDFALRFTLQKNATAVGTVVRVLIIRDKQQISDTSPGVTDILNSADVNSHYNAQLSDRFQYLSDQTITLDADDVLIAKQFKLNPQGLHVLFNGSSGTDIQKNGLYLVLVSNEPTLTPTFNGISRFQFYDN